MAFREAEFDKLKEGVLLKKARTERCTVEGCGKVLTPYQGPGSDKYCRSHQRSLSEYGGLATGRKTYSFSRNDSCDCCGFDPLRHRWIKSITDKKVQNAAIRSVLTVDHIDGNHDNNDPKNLQTLCPTCHNIKTIAHGDHLSK